MGFIDPVGDFSGETKVDSLGSLKGLDGRRKCLTCGGSGRIYGVGFLGLGSEVCPKCKGDGYLYN